jgi:putative zinc finger/helix-turn-helix YgiT family protein
MAKVSAKKGYCPSCESELSLESIRKRESVTVRGEEIAVQAAYWRCRTCGEEFEGPGDHDEVAEAYDLYRIKKGLMQPAEIKQLREGYGLTQGELAKILGFGAVTLSRYENGMLQTSAQDRMLRMARDSRTFWNLCNQTADAGELPPATLRRIREKILEGTDQATLDPVVQLALAHGADEFSGARRFLPEKYRGAVLFLCEEPCWKTTLNKQLFYADFTCYREHGRSITGARYAHLPFGPCPDKFEALFAWLAERKDIAICEKVVGKHTGEMVRALRRPAASLFTTREHEILRDVRTRLGRLTAKALSNLSHGEPGYQETQDGELISYRYAKVLRG